jgi:regulator of ribonuclease activity A
MNFDTADLCDAHGENVKVLAPNFISFGGVEKCAGEIVSLRIDEDNSGLITLLKENGKGKIAVVDAGERYVAVVGDTLMGYAKENGWEGILINGYVRDTDNTLNIDVGLFALGTCPRKSKKKALSERDVELSFADITCKSGEYLYADNDGIIISETALI